MLFAENRVEEAVQNKKKTEELNLQKISISIK